MIVHSETIVVDGENERKRGGRRCEREGEGEGDGVGDGEDVDEGVVDVGEG